MNLVTHTRKDKIWVPNREIKLVSFPIKNQYFFTFLLLKDDEFRNIDRRRIINRFYEYWNLYMIHSISVHCRDSHDVLSIEVLISDLMKLKRKVILTNLQLRKLSMRYNGGGIGATFSQKSNCITSSAEE